LIGLYAPHSLVPIESRIHSISITDGALIWESKALLGACSGTPVISFDDKYVFVTHNRMTNGTFTILHASSGVVFFQAADAQQLLSPPGIFFFPSQGNFQGGEGNMNDLVVYANKPSLTNVEVPMDSATYAFQFPIGFAGSKEGLKVTTLLNNSDFQTFTPPLITNQGNSMYWGVSRSKVIGWIGIAFDRDVGGNNIGYGRGDPPSLPILSEIVMGKDTVSPSLYTGTAENAFAAISTAGDILSPLWNISTSSPVYAKSHVTTHNGSEAIFFIEELGKAYLLDGKTGRQIWSFMASDSKVLGNFAKNSQGTIVYFADTNGYLTALQIVAATTANNLTFTGPSMSPVSSFPTSRTPVAITSNSTSGAPSPSNSTSEAPVAMTPTVGVPNASVPTAGIPIAFTTPVVGPYALVPTVGVPTAFTTPVAGPYGLVPTTGVPMASTTPVREQNSTYGPVVNAPTGATPSPLSQTSSSSPVIITSLSSIPTTSGVPPTGSAPSDAEVPTFPPESAPALLSPNNPTLTKVPTTSALTDKPSSTAYEIKLHVLTVCIYTIFLWL
jgi:hypothetical protein